VGDPRWVAAWRSLLRHDNPFTQRLAVTVLPQTAIYNPGCGDFVQRGLFALLEGGDVDTAELVARFLPTMLSPAGQSWARIQLKRSRRDGPRQARVWYSLALRCVAPLDADALRILLADLADDEIPLDHRRSAAIQRVLAGEPASDVALIHDVREELLDWTKLDRDPAIRDALAAFVLRVFDGADLLEDSEELPVHERAATLVRSLSDRAVSDARKRRSDVVALERGAAYRGDWPRLSLAAERYLSLADRMVACDPRAMDFRVADPNEVSRVVRALRAGVAAHDAGDFSAASAGLYQSVEDLDRLGAAVPAHLLPEPLDALRERVEQVEQYFVDRAVERLWKEREGK